MERNEETGGIGRRDGGECLGRCRPSGPKADARDYVSIDEAVVRVMVRIEAHLAVHHSVSTGLRQAEDHFARCAGFDCPVELGLQLAGNAELIAGHDHRMTYRHYGKSALGLCKAGETDHRRTFSTTAQATWNAMIAMPSAVVYGRMSCMMPSPQAACGENVDRSTPCFFASFTIPGIRQSGIDFAPFQLDTVDGVSFSARATATVPPSASMMSAAFCMGHYYDNRNMDASG